MERVRKERLIRYLYPSVEITEFLFNDLYVELSSVMPKEIVFSNKNQNSNKRQENYLIAKNIIKNFISDNPVYKDKIIELYKSNNFDIIAQNVIIGYVFYLTPHINKGTGADVFLDKRSVCYSKISILDSDI